MVWCMVSNDYGTKVAGTAMGEARSCNRLFFLIAGGHNA